MKKIATIDFDIIMNPCIDLYNDSDLSVDEYLNKFDFLGWLGADLALYRTLTNLVMNFDKNRIEFIESHDEIVPEIEEPIILYNIDYHHDIAYKNEDLTYRFQDYNEGNWVKKLWDSDLIEEYIWLKDYNSADVDEEGEKYITEEHYVYNYDLSELLEADKLYICFSPEWVPYYYAPLYYLWQDLTK
jgi:hypothetical protein